MRREIIRDGYDETTYSLGVLSVEEVSRATFGTLEDGRDYDVISATSVEKPCTRVKGVSGLIDFLRKNPDVAGTLGEIRRVAKPEEVKK